jgi:2-polyprenyl-3-methyl-5-hydroxy-6-metoxy-1,4-benzoquinol methylase
LNLQGHTYPNWLKKQPQFIQLSWIFKHVFYQRTRFLKREILEVLLKSEFTDKPNHSQFDLLDVGSGDGQFAFFAKNRFKTIRVFCNDISADNIEFCELYGRKYNLKDIVSSTDLTPNQIQSVQTVMALSVLQYVQDEIGFLTNIHNVMHENSKLLLYVPINHRKIGWLYMIIFHSFETYESKQNRKKVYSLIQLQSILKQSGFEIIKTTFSCGKNGIRAQEWTSNAITLLSQSNYLYKVIGLIYGLLAFIPILIYQFKDKFSSKNEQTSNAVLFECKQL